MARIAGSDAVPDHLADLSRPSGERTRLGGVSALVAAVALLAFPDGSAAVAIIGALVVLAAWYLLTPPYAFALGHVALAAVLPEGAFGQGTHVVWIAAVEAGLLGILLSSVMGDSPAGFSSPDDREGSEGLADATSRAVPGAGLVLGWVVVGGALAWASARSSLGLTTAGGLLVVLAALAVYGLHRYQLVSLGLVDDVKGDSGGDGDE